MSRRNHTRFDEPISPEDFDAWPGTITEPLPDETAAPEASFDWPMLCPRHNRKITREECDRTLAEDLDTGESCPPKCLRFWDAETERKERLRENIRALCQKLGLALSPEHFRRLVGLVALYPEFRAYEEHRERHADTRRQVNALDKAARSLLNAIAGAQRTAFLLAEITDSDIRFAHALERRTRHAAELIRNARGGRPRRFGLSSWLKEMSKIYAEATGNAITIETDRNAGEFRGPLYELCHGCLEAAGGLGEELTSAALGAALKRMIYPRKKKQPLRSENLCPN
jgi:hypothetical protein